MSMLAVVGVLFGIILGQFFKFFVLIPASGLATFLVLTNPMQTDSVWGWFIQFAAATTTLQIGYVIGLVARNFYHEPKRSKQLKNPHFDEISSSHAETPERDRRAA
jgi:hypothetical protein